MRILVTGATGFIGSHLIERLVQEGHKLKALVRNEKDFEARNETNVLLKKLNVEICEGDLLDKDSLKKAVKNVEVIFHLAAIARPMEIPKSLYFKINEEGTKNLLEACKGKKMKKIVVMSSISAVGPTVDGDPVSEKTRCAPIDPYGWSKLAQENVGIDYFKKCKLPVVLLRPSMVFGPRDFEMLRLFKAVNKRFFPLSRNEKGIDFLYVENLVEACVLAMKNGKSGEKYHISNGRAYSLNELVNSISHAEGKKVLPIYFPKFFFKFAGYFIEFFGKIFRFHAPFKHDTVDWMTKKFWIADISKAKKELGYNPKISLDEGVIRTVDYYKKTGLL